jgi:flagellar motor switch protein FliG
MKEKQPEQKIFINGKGQLIKMMQLLSLREKEKLLKNIRHRNPGLASELLRSSYTFNDLQNLEDSKLKNLFSRVDSAILGIAIKGLDEEFQRRILSLAPRNYAENAFDSMNKNLGGKHSLIEKSRQKVLEALT